MKNDLCSLPATDLLRLYRTRKASPVEATRAVLARIDKLNPKLNCFCLVDEKSAILRHWAAEGRIADLPPHHLIFSIWALTQHYADFDVQVRAVLGPGHDPFAEADAFLDTLFRKLLAPA